MLPPLLTTLLERRGGGGAQLFGGSARKEANLLLLLLSLAITHVEWTLYAHTHLSHSITTHARASRTRTSADLIIGHGDIFYIAPNNNTFQNTLPFACTTSR